MIVVTFTIDIFLTYQTIGTGTDGHRYGSHIWLGCESGSRGGDEPCETGWSSSFVYNLWGLFQKKQECPRIIDSSSEHGNAKVYFIRKPAFWTYL